MTGIRIGEASHPGPIDLPSFVARPVGKCLRSSCQRVLTTNDFREQCPVCHSFPVCRACHDRQEAIRECECPLSGRPVPNQYRRDSFFSPAGLRRATGCDYEPDVPCPIPGCLEKVKGFGQRLQHSCRNCLLLPVCDKCHQDPPPKWCNCDLIRYFERRHRMDYRNRRPDPVVPNLFQTVDWVPRVAPERRDNTFSGGGSRSSGANAPPGATVESPHEADTSAGGQDTATVISAAATHPRVFPPKPRVSRPRKMSVWRFTQKARQRLRPRAKPDLGRTALRWDMSKHTKERNATRHLFSTLHESVRP